MNFWNFPHRPKYHHSYCQRDTNCILDQSSSPFTKLSVAQHGFFWLTNAAGVDGRVPHAKNACYRTQVHDVKYVSNFCFDSWHCSMPASSMIIETRPFLAAKHDWTPCVDGYSLDAAPLKGQEILLDAWSDRYSQRCVTSISYLSPMMRMGIDIQSSWAPRLCGCSSINDRLPNKTPPKFNCYFSFFGGSAFQ
jgi:hypothetical protein